MFAFVLSGLLSRDRSLDGLLLCSLDLTLDLLLLLTAAPAASSTTEPDGELDRDPSYL